MNVSVTILGSGTGVPWRGRGSPGLAVRVVTDDDTRLALIDPSAGASHRAVAFGHDVTKLSHIAVTHFHPDHTGDVAPLLFALRNPKLRGVGAEAPIELVGPRGIVDLLGRLRDVYGAWIDLGDRLVVRELDPAAADAWFAVGPLEITCFPVDHADNSLAYRFEARGGGVLTYSGDTDVCDGIVAAARNADTLILECAFPEGQKCAGHLTPSEAGRIATAANVKRLILTHLYPECWGEDLLSPCRERFRGEVLIAEDGMTVEI